MNNPELLKAWLSFVASLAWPAVVIAIFIMFKTKISTLIDRIKSGEVAGAKFSFNEAASEFIQSKIDDLAKQPDSGERAVLAEEIKGIAAVLGSIHPVALAILIDAAEGLHSWIGSAYLDKKRYFESLERAGLATVRTSTDESGRLEARILFSDRGRDLLRGIGMTPKQ